MSQYSLVPEESVTKRSVRWDRIIQSACKQCLQPYFPSITEPKTLQQVISNFSPSNFNHIIFGHIGGSTIQNALSSIAPSQANRDSPVNICMIVGPEGGLSDDEIAQLLNNGAKPISLHLHRLRTETASISITSNVSAFMYSLYGTGISDKPQSE